MEKIQVIKLYNGDEIIGFTEDFGDKIVIKEAFQFFLKADKTGLHTIAMDHWLPVPLVKENEATLPRDKIIAIMEPSDDFKEYYENALDSVQKSKEEKDKLDLIDNGSEDKLKMLLDALEVPESRFIN
jgi:hypothetical protein